MSSRKLDRLHRAVMTNDYLAVKAALEDKVPVDSLDREDRTALFYAAKDGNLEIAEILIANGASINASDKNHESPLHFAAREFKVDIAELLLRNRALVDAQNLHGNTPLSLAVYASRGRGEMIKLLMSYSANKNLKNKYGISAEDLAKSIANHNIIQFLE